METIRILDYQRSAPHFRHLSDEKLACIHEHADEVNLEYGVMIARQGGQADGFKVGLPVDGSGSEQTLASRNLRSETGS